MTSEANDNNIFLRNYDIWKQLLKYNTSSGSMSEVMRPKGDIKISGVYRRWHNGYVMFYKKQGAFCFQVEGKEILLEANDFIIQFKRMGRFNLFQILISEGIVFSHKYESLRYDELNKIHPDFNEDREEDQDFFLFIFNVMSNEDRRNRIYSN